MGEFLSGRSLCFLEQKEDYGRIYVIADATSRDLSRILVAVGPKQDSACHVRDMRFQLPKDVPPAAWAAEANSVFRFQPSPND